MPDIFYATISPTGLPVWSNERLVMEALLKWKLKAVYAKFWRLTGQRTGIQNNALHKFYELLAKELNDSGLTMQKVLEKRVEINWTPALVKEVIWRPIQIAVTGKESTTQLDKTSDIDETYEHVNRFLADGFHLHVPFPSEEQMK